MTQQPSCHVFATFVGKEISAPSYCERRFARCPLRQGSAIGSHRPASQKCGQRFHHVVTFRWFVFGCIFSHVALLTRPDNSTVVPDVTKTSTSRPIAYARTSISRDMLLGLVRSIVTCPIKQRLPTRLQRPTIGSAVPCGTNHLRRRATARATNDDWTYPFRAESAGQVLGSAPRPRGSDL